MNGSLAINRKHDIKSCAIRIRQKIEFKLAILYGFCYETNSMSKV